MSADALTPPTTLLGGFLGTGKTTALKHMLTNRAGLRIAVLVNDVASVNVDAATMRATTVELKKDEGSVEMIELENGCVCCGPGADTLAPAVRALADKRDDGGAPSFDHIVIELSGVADPSNVQNNLSTEGLGVRRKVALVDANAFPSMFNSVQKMGDRVDLAGAELFEDPCAVDRRVVDLLLKQIEVADVIVVNKTDLATPDELRTTLSTCKALNKQASIISTTFGNAALAEMLPLGDPLDAEIADPFNVESNGRIRIRIEDGCGNPDCSDPDCGDPDCTDTSNKETSSCGNAACSDPACSDPDCADSSSKKTSVPNSVESIGFMTYTYRARRPFRSRSVDGRPGLQQLIAQWPLPKKDVLTFESLSAPGLAGVTAKNAQGQLDKTFANVLRSKGISWLDEQYEVKAEWSHAGRHFQIRGAGPWWATLPDQIVKQSLSSDGVTEEQSPAYLAERARYQGEFGDRRNELVFIGTGLDTAAIEGALNACLLTDSEMDVYRAGWAAEDARRAQESGPFRFEVGTTVECCMGENFWAKGKIVKQYYREPDWPADRWMPYQVQLDDEQLIWAPADVDDCIRRA
jgi:G3E family GTPase